MSTMSRNETQITVTSDVEIEMTRTFDAPRELVYAACTRPEHMAQWWGPNGFTNTVQQMDVRTGGPLAGRVPVSS